MRRLQDKNNIKRFVKKFLGYAAAFCVPVAALGAMLLYNNTANLNRESEARISGNFQQFQGSFDHMILKMQNVVLHMSSNSEWLGLNAGETEETEFLRLFESYGNSLPYNIKMIYYKRASSKIYMGGENISYREFEALSGALPLSLAGFFTRMNSTATAASMTLNPDYGRDSVYSTAFLYPVPEISRKPVGTMGFLVEEKLVRQSLENYVDIPSARLYIYNLSLQNIFALAESDDALARELTSYGSGLSTDNIGGVNMVILRATSTESGYTYIMTIPKDEFYADSRESTRAFMLLNTCIITFCIAMAFIYAKNSILSLQNAETRQMELSASIDNQSAIIRELVLKKLLGGRGGNPEETRYDLACASLNFAFDSFAVLVAQFPNGANEAEQETALLPDSDELPAARYESYLIKEPEKNRVTMLLNLSASTGIKPVIEDAAQKLSLNTEIGISEIHGSISEIGAAYVEAIVSVIEKLNPVYPRVFRFIKTERQSEGFAYPYVEHALILESLRSGNADLAAETLRSVFAAISPATSELLRRCLCYDIINMVAKISNSLNMPLSNQDISTLSAYQSPDDLESRLITVVNELGEKCREQNDRLLISTKRDIIEYIQRNRLSNELSLGMIADEFHLSQTYISRLVKEETGQNFLSYITQLRMSEIKRLLAETEIPIRDIILQSGYLDVASFNRKFKKIEGITPGQYRSICHEKAGRQILG